MQSSGLDATQSRSPFTPHILSIYVPQPFKMPVKIDPYTGNKDPGDHLKRFHAVKDIVSMKDPQRCRIFGSTLTEVAIEWYTELPPASIHCYVELVKQLMCRFETSRVTKKTSDHLTGFIQNKGDPLKEYLNRLNKLSIQISRLKDMSSISFNKLSIQTWVTLSIAPNSTL